MLDEGTREATSLVRMRPATMKGWRPISVTYHPAMVATQPAKVIAANSCSIGRGIRREIPAIAPMPPQADPADQQHQDAGPHHDPKTPEHRKDRRMGRWKLVQSLDFAVSIMREDQAREFWYGQLETVRPRSHHPGSRTGAAARRALFPRHLPSPRSSAADASAY